MVMKKLGFILFFILEKWYHIVSGNEESYGTETCGFSKKNGTGQS